jgi:hypothetical protein
MWSGSTAVDGAAAPWLNAALGAQYLYYASGVVRIYTKVAMAGATADWVVVGSTQQATGFISIPLASGRELSSNDIINTAGDAGVLSKNTTPILEKLNAGGGDGALRLNWATSNVDLVTYQFAVPPDLDGTQPVLVKFRAAMEGVTDTPTITVSSWWDTGDTKVDDATGGVTGTAVATYTATIAAADVPDTAYTCTINLTPGTHGTASHALYVYAIWVEYAKK